MGPMLSPAFSAYKLLDKNKPGTPETRAAASFNANARAAQGQGSAMLTRPAAGGQF